MSYPNVNICFQCEHVEFSTRFQNRIHIYCTVNGEDQLAEFYCYEKGNGNCYYDSEGENLSLKRNYKAILIGIKSVFPNEQCPYAVEHIMGNQK